jgi:hypothetical protein
VQKPKQAIGYYASTVLALLAFAVIASGAAWVAYDAAQSQLRHQQNAKDAADYHARRAKVRVERSCLTLATAEQFNCVNQTQSTASAEQREEYDLEAQRNSATWTRAAAIAAIIGVALSIVGMGLILITFRETRRAANAAQRTYEAFIAVETASLIPVVISGNNSGSDMIKMGVEITNIGRSTAHILHVQYSALNDWHPIEEFKSFTHIGRAIKQDETLSFDEALLIQRGRPDPVFVGGYVEYRTRFGTNHRSYFCGSVDPAGMSDGIVRYRDYSSQPAKGNDWPDDT